MLIKPLKKISILISFFLLTSCYESLDFNQLEDYTFKPVITISFAYFKIKTEKLFDSSGTIEQTSISEVANFNFFNDPNISKDLVKVDFNAEIKNEFERTIIFKVELLDQSNRVVYAFKSMIVDANNLNYQFLEEIVIDANPDILLTTKVRMTSELLAGGPLNSSDPSEFEFKSSASLYIESNI